MIAWDAASVHVRVWAFGALCVEYRAEDRTWRTVQQEEWGGNSNSRRLLRYLLTVGRSARRGEIMEALWPESTSTYVEEYLNKAATNLRKVFRSEEALISNPKRTTYQLAQPAVVWTDVDACEVALQEAERIGSTTQEGSRLLETAQEYFARGRFFEGEDGTWCHAKRERLVYLGAITRNHWHLYVHATSKGDLLSSFCGHLQTLLQFLRATPAGVQQNHLYSLAGESAQMIGEILFDMQDYQQAQTYYHFSIVAAKEAGNNALRAVGLGRMSFLPIYRDEPLQACPLLEEAKQLLTDVSRPTIHAWLAVVEAEVMAHLRDDIACEKALAQAEAQYHPNAPEEDALWTRLNDATIPGYKGACYLQLQQPHKALEALQKTLAVIPTYSSRHQSIILTDMAAAMLQMTEVEETCQLLHVQSPES